MRAALGLGAEVSDAAVVDAYVASLGFGIAVQPAASQPTDPWARAVATLFRAPGSVAAIYTAAGALPIPTRAIPSRGDENTRFDGSAILQAGNRFQLLRADVPAPRGGDALIITDPSDGTTTAFELYGDAWMDAEGVSWTCSVNPA